MAKQVSEMMALPFAISSSRKVMPKSESVRVIFLWTEDGSAQLFCGEILLRVIGLHMSEGFFFFVFLRLRISEMKETSVLWPFPDTQLP